MSGLEGVMFSEDTEWSQAKHIAKMTGFQNNWVEIISYYSELGGNKVQLFSILDEDQKRVIDVLDSGDVLVINREKELQVYDYTEVNQSKKSFFFNDNPIEKVITLPNDNKIDEENEVKIYE